MRKKNRIFAGLAMTIVATASFALICILVPLSFAREIDVSGSVSGRIYDLNLEVHNKGLYEIRLIGAHETCGLGGCITLPGIPCVIGPMSGRSVAVKFEAQAFVDIEDVEFVRDVTIFTDSIYQPRIVFTIRGKVQK